jgi:hypothetical protein
MTGKATLVTVIGKVRPVTMLVEALIEPIGSTTFGAQMHRSSRPLNW